MFCYVLLQQKLHTKMNSIMIIYILQNGVASL